MTAPGVRAPSRQELEALPAELLNRGNRRNPDVLLVRVDGTPVVVKDFAPRGPLVRAGLARWITARELRAWRALDGHPNVPRLVGSIDPLAFAVEYRPGRRMSRKLAGQVPADFLAQLDAGVREMHRRGVAHLDLRHRSNVMVGEDGAPILIDFGSAVTVCPGGLAARWLLPALARIDLAALKKWQPRLFPPSSA